MGPVVNFLQQRDHSGTPPKQDSGVQDFTRSLGGCNNAVSLERWALVLDSRIRLDSRILHSRVPKGLMGAVINFFCKPKTIQASCEIRISGSTNLLHALTVVTFITCLRSCILHSSVPKGRVGPVLHSSPTRDQIGTPSKNQ